MQRRSICHNISPFKSINSSLVVFCGGCVFFNLFVQENRLFFFFCIACAVLFLLITSPCYHLTCSPDLDVFYIILLTCTGMNRFKFHILGKTTHRYYNVRVFFSFYEVTNHRWSLLWTVNLLEVTKWLYNKSFIP